MAEFMIWLEFEAFDFTSSLNAQTGQFEKTDWNNSNGFCNVHITLQDGRRYGLNVWTFDFLAATTGHDQESGEKLGGLYAIPPDLFVRELTRPCIEAAICDLLKRGNLEQVLNPSIIDTSLAEDDE